MAAPKGRGNGGLAGRQRPGRRAAVRGDRRGAGLRRAAGDARARTIRGAELAAVIAASASAESNTR
ncbi:hypothetical protein San01_54440 [Streptomyces angustmyceticus]|uniref:Uncharacterized protein n=1 Tax=Streptomyces angustmyceticus TaxID=285578 RepID=A0A5J4LMT9_9ACTN|nr:hypothetical protein San01_54440 [Streptomyces angustmyceticus]